MKYSVLVTRTLIERGRFEIEAESREEALRKYYEPTAGEHIYFDDETTWWEVDVSYDAEIER